MNQAFIYQLATTRPMFFQQAWFICVEERRERESFHRGTIFGVQTRKKIISDFWSAQPFRRANRNTSNKTPFLFPTHALPSKDEKWFFFELRIRNGISVDRIQCDPFLAHDGAHSSRIGPSSLPLSSLRVPLSRKWRHAVARRRGGASFVQTRNRTPRHVVVLVLAFVFPIGKLWRTIFQKIQRVIKLTAAARAKVNPSFTSAVKSGAFYLNHHIS